MSVRLQDSFFRALFESRMAGLAVADLGTQCIVEVNDLMLEILGRERGEILGVPFVWRDVTPPEYHALDEEALRQVMAGGQSDPFEKEYVRPDGSRVPVRVSSAIVPEFPDKLIVFVTDLTAEKRSDAAVRESEAQLRLLADSLPVLVSFVDTDLRYRFVNRAYELWFARPRPEVLGKSIEELLGAEAMEARREAINGALAGEPQSFEAMTPRADGATRVTHVQYIPRPGPDSRIEGFFVLVTDVTDRKQIEAELRRHIEALTESEARFREVADAAPVLIWVADTDNRGIWYNKAWLDFTGRTLDQELGDGWLEGVHPDDLDTCARLCGGAFVHREPFRFDFRLRRHDGEWRIVDDTGVPRFAADGTFLGYIGCCVDVTDARQAESALRASEERYRRIFEQTSDLILTADLAQVITDCNPSAAAAVGVSRSEVIGRKISEFVSPEDFERTTAMLRQKLEQGGTTRYDVRVRSSTGEWLFWEVNSGLTFDETGTPVGLHVVGRDVTERKRWERHQQLLVAELNHRVKNTLSIVQSLAHQTFTPDNPPAAAIRSYEGRLGALAAAHSLLTRENWEAAPIHDLVQEAMSLFCPDGRCHARGPELRLPPRIAVSLSLALHELATNAAKYGSLSTKSGEVEIVWQAVNGDLEITWTERGGPPVGEPTSTGFGTRMLKRALASDLRGEVQLSFEPTGLRCEIRAPMPKVDAP
jgi:PAS domain S-box-containing protein